MSDTAKPQVGLGVFVIKDHEVLFGYRLSEHGKDVWGLPGGKLDIGESPEECARRETLEECGLQIKNVRFVGITNDVFSKDKHYVTIFMAGDWVKGTPKVLEPDKLIKWQFRKWGDWPEPLFLPLQNLLKSEFLSVLKKL